MSGPLPFNCVNNIAGDSHLSLFKYYPVLKAGGGNKVKVGGTHTGLIFQRHQRHVRNLCIVAAKNVVVLLANVMLRTLNVQNCAIVKEVVHQTN